MGGRLPGGAKDLLVTAIAAAVAALAASQRGEPKRNRFARARTTAIHSLTDAAGRPRVLLVAPGNVHDVMMPEELPCFLALHGSAAVAFASTGFDLEQRCGHGKCQTENLCHANAGSAVRTATSVAMTSRRVTPQLPAPRACPSSYGSLQTSARCQ
jgi:hypothetical protein